MTEPAQEQFLDDSQLAKWIYGSQWVLLFCTVGWLLSEVFWAGLMSQRIREGKAFRPLPDALMAGVDLAETLLLLPTLLSALLAHLLFLKWIGRINHNLRARGVQGLKFTPNGCVWAYFVPFANLVWPVQSMSENWNAAHHPDDWQERSTRPLVGAWWGTFVAMAFVNRLSTNMMTREKGEEALMHAMIASAVGSVLTLVAVWLERVLMKRIRGAMAGEVAASEVELKRGVEDEDPFHRAGG